MSSDMVITPGGPRARDSVHPLAAGTVLDASGGVLRNRHADGRVLAEFGAMPPVSDKSIALMAHQVLPTPDALAPPGGIGTGWITYASWLNTTGTPVTQYTSIWNVPAAPLSQDGQLLYLFNGMQNNAGYIYQPVLQWGISPAGGGNFWSVATWYVGPPGQPSFHTESVHRVEVGDPLVGVMTLSGQSGLGFSYDAGFLGVPNSGWSIINMPELNWLVVTLEAYRMVTCSDYPAVDRTTFFGIDVKQSNGRPPLAWTTHDDVVDCGQHTVVHSSSPDGGCVDLCYRSAPRIDDMVLWNNSKAYAFNGSTYARYDVASDRMDPGYPVAIAGNWPGLPAGWTADLDAMVKWNNGKAYVFKGSRYYRYDIATDRADPGYPLRIGGHWPGFPSAFEASIDAGVVWNDHKAYFFKGDKYIRYDLAADRTDPGYPLPIGGHWRGLPASFNAGIDAIVLWTNGKAYLFKGKQYCRYDVAGDRMDPGYPQAIAGNWRGLPASYT